MRLADKAAKEVLVRRLAAPIKEYYLEFSKIEAEKKTYPSVYEKPSHNTYVVFVPGWSAKSDRIYRATALVAAARKDDHVPPRTDAKIFAGPFREDQMIFFGLKTGALSAEAIQEVLDSGKVKLSASQTKRMWARWSEFCPSRSNAALAAAAEYTPVLV